MVSNVFCPSSISRHIPVFSMLTKNGSFNLSNKYRTRADQFLLVCRHRIELESNLLSSTNKVSAVFCRQ